MLGRISLGLFLALALLQAGTHRAGAWTMEDWNRCQGIANDSGLAPEARIAACTQLIHTGQLTPENLAIAYYDRGIDDSLDKLPDQAMADYTKAIAINPNYADALYNRGDLYRNKGLYDQAIADYTKSIAIEPAYDVYLNRGICYEKKGMRNQAMADYQASLNYAKPGSAGAQSAQQALQHLSASQ